MYCTLITRNTDTAELYLRLTTGSQPSDDVYHFYVAYTADPLSLLTTLIRTGM